MYAFIENLLLAVTTLFTNKLRSLLTVLGVVVGTFTVIAVASVLTGLKVRTKELAEQTGPNVLYVTKYDNIGPRFSRPPAEERQRKVLVYEDALAINELPSVYAASPQLIVGSFGPSASQFSVKYKGQEAVRPIIFGVWANYPEVRVVTLKAGRFFTKEEHDRKLNVVILGPVVAENLFQKTDPLEKEIEIEGALFRVIGVLDKGASGLFGDTVEDRQLLIPYATAAKQHPEIVNGDRGISVIAHSRDGQFNRMQDEITELMRRRRGVRSDQPNNFGLNTPDAIFATFDSITTFLTLIVIPISGAGLLVGGVGVMNIMLVSVTERTREIGVRRAIGARRFDILTQFLIEAISLTSTGGGIGILIGVGISWGLNVFFPSIPSVVPLWSVFVGFGISAGVGVIFGLWPALRAARLDPAEALRYE
ncbi:MAG: ABC transporter permease [Blastocatellia bacterium]|nr:ABC transporter permease [Blastocatellia bacterium]